MSSKITYHSNANNNTNNNNTTVNLLGVSSTSWPGGARRGLGEEGVSVKINNIDNIDNIIYMVVFSTKW